MQTQPNGIQDGIEQHPSGKVIKSKKKKILIIFGIIILLLFLIFYLNYNPITKGAMRFRCWSLIAWYEHVKPYISENGQKSLSLFEICQAEYRKNQRPFPMSTTLSNDSFPDKYSYSWKLVDDPNKFNKEVPYGLFYTPQGWFIRELVPGKLYKKMLMIDQDGNIYELRAVPKEKYELKY